MYRFSIALEYMYILRAADPTNNERSIDTKSPVFSSCKIIEISNMTLPIKNVIKGNIMNTSILNKYSKGLFSWCMMVNIVKI